MWTIKGLKNIERMQEARKDKRAFLAHQIELSVWQTSDELERADKALAEYDESIAIMDATCKSAWQSLNA